LKFREVTAMLGVKVSQDVLQDAWMELNFVKNRRFPQDVARGINWRDVEEQLKRVERALREGDERAIREATSAVSKQLTNPRRDIRRIIGAELRDNTQPLPPPVWEHLNHIVSTLQTELKLSPPAAGERADAERGEPPAEPSDKTC
jgi:hypothetical protein